MHISKKSESTEVSLFEVRKKIVNDKLLIKKNFVTCG